MSPAEYNVPTPDDRTTIACLYCGKQLEVGRKTLSITCKFCHKSLKLEDIRIKDDVTVQDAINCGGAVIRGKVKGNIKSRGPVLVGPEAEIKGDVTTTVLAVGAGAILQGHYEVGTTFTAQKELPMKSER
jgi:cytoskeletal protein CcmA (bactofilin family)